jgi:hypothetical protein
MENSKINRFILSDTVEQIHETRPVIGEQTSTAITSSYNFKVFVDLLQHNLRESNSQDDIIVSFDTMEREEYIDNLVKSLNNLPNYHNLKILKIIEESNGLSNIRDIAEGEFTRKENANNVYNNTFSSDNDLLRNSINNGDLITLPGYYLLYIYNKDNNELISTKRINIKFPEDDSILPGSPRKSPFDSLLWKVVGIGVLIFLVVVIITGFFPSITSRFTKSSAKEQVSETLTDRIILTNTPQIRETEV